MLGYWNYTVYLTYVSLVSAVYGLCCCVQGELTFAVICLMVSGVCDMLDGSIARTNKKRTKNECRFGVQIDSLSDVVAFGILPAVIGYAAGVRSALGMLCLIWVALAGLIRLAYFNVMAAEHEESHAVGGMDFRGVPIPFVVPMVPLVFCFDKILAPAGFQILYAAVMLVTGFLFLLPVTLKKAKAKGLVVIFLLCAACCIAFFLTR